jgi:Restriction endonuclease BglII
LRIVEIYSHLNGKEHILVHKPAIWKDIELVVSKVDATKCRTKQSKEARKVGKGLLYAPKAMNAMFKSELTDLGWKEDRVSYWVTADAELIVKTMTMAAKDQKAAIVREGKKPIGSYNQTDFAKDRVHVEVQFGKYSFVAYDLFVKHVAFFVGNKIDVGIEILPMKELQDCMSSGVPYYEAELYNLLRQGRSSPAVPLVLVGIAP